MTPLTTSIIRDLHIANPTSNWVFSPASYMEAMGNLSVCIKGRNLEELLLAAPHIGGKHAEGLDTYNALLYAKEYLPHIEKNISDILAARGADLRPFSGIEVIDLVNRICREKTNGKIDNLLSADDYDPFLKLVLLNCVYFKRDWVYPFDEPWGSSPFYGTNGETQVKYLKNQHWFNYHEDETVDIAELPYKDSDVCCYLIVPRNNLFEVFNDIKSNLAKISKVKRGLEVNLWAPPFKTESAMNLVPLTKQAGVTSIFEANFGDGWSLVDLPKLAPNSYMKVSFIKQKAYIDFTRKGTEAAAATAIGMLNCSGAFFGQPPPVKFIHADKPFLYVLTRKQDPSNILFAGVINNV